MGFDINRSCFPLMSLLSDGSRLAIQSVRWWVKHTSSCRYVIHSEVRSLVLGCKSRKEGGPQCWAHHTPPAEAPLRY